LIGLPHGSNTAVELRNAFDRARAIPLSSQALAPIEDLLAIRVSGHAFAIRLSEISGLATDKKIVAFPSPIRELLGMATIRGRLVSVYSLAALLGYGATTDRGRWLALCGTEELVALAINDFEAYLRVPVAQIHAAEQQDLVSAHVKHVVRVADTVRAVISMPLITRVIRTRCGSANEPKER
jgi:chemotaxis signal transduction protein